MSLNTITGEVRDDLPFSWEIPQNLIGWTLEDYNNSIEHHYGV